MSMSLPEDAFGQIEGVPDTIKAVSLGDKYTWLMNGSKSMKGRAYKHNNQHVIQEVKLTGLRAKVFRTHLLQKSNNKVYLLGKTADEDGVLFCLTGEEISLESLVADYEDDNEEELDDKNEDDDDDDDDDEDDNEEELDDKNEDDDDDDDDDDDEEHDDYDDDYDDDDDDEEHDDEGRKNKKRKRTKKIGGLYTHEIREKEREKLIEQLQDNGLDSHVKNVWTAEDKTASNADLLGQVTTDEWESLTPSFQMDGGPCKVVKIDKDNDIVIYAHQVFIKSTGSMMYKKTEASYSKIEKFIYPKKRGAAPGTSRNPVQKRTIEVCEEDEEEEYSDDQEDQEDVPCPRCAYQAGITKGRPPNHTCGIMTTQKPKKSKKSRVDDSDFKKSITAITSLAVAKKMTPEEFLAHMKNITKC